MSGSFTPLPGRAADAQGKGPRDVGYLLQFGVFIFPGLVSTPHTRYGRRAGEGGREVRREGELGEGGEERGEGAGGLRDRTGGRERGKD